MKQGVIGWICRMTGANSCASAPDWERIARLKVGASRGTFQVAVKCDRLFRRIKLRSHGADIVVSRWMLQFHDGSIMDLSVNGLVDGSESRPMPIAGRRLTQVVVYFDANRTGRRAKLEIWAEP